MAGLTRFLFLMNPGERSGVSTNVCKGFAHFKKDVEFRGVKKLFVLQRRSGVFLLLRSENSPICDAPNQK